MSDFPVEIPIGYPYIDHVTTFNMIDYNSPQKRLYASLMATRPRMVTSKDCGAFPKWLRWLKCQQLQWFPFDTCTGEFDVSEGISYSNESFRTFAFQLIYK